MFFKIKHNTDALSDAEIIAKYKSSNDVYFVGELYKRHSHLVYGVGLKYLQNKDEAKELTMIVFEKIINSLLSTEVKSFPAWLYVIARNESFTILKATKTESGLENLENIADNFVEFDAEINHINEAEIKEAALAECMKKLIVEQSTCIKMFYYKELTYADIEKKTGYAIKKVKSYLQNGKRNLKNCLEASNVA